MQVVDGGKLAGKLAPLVETLWKQKTGGGYEDAAVEPRFMPWDAVRAEVTRLAAAMKAHGVEKGDRVAVLGETSRAWVLAGHAIHAAGGVVVPIYPTLPDDQVQYILNDAGAKLVMADDSQKPKLKRFKGTIWTLGAVEGKPSKARPAKVALKDPALLIYTSGTTGTPKGVLLSHENIAGDVAAAIQGLDLDKIKDPSLVAFLPLAHVAGYISLAALMAIGGRVLFSRPERMSADLAAFHPTIVLAVPRLWERIMRKVDEAVAEDGGVKAFLFGRARKVAIASGRAMDNGGELKGRIARKHRFYEKLIYSKLRTKIGMDRTQLCITGAAAVRPDLLWLLQGLGLPIVEGYGMTESSALSSSTRTHQWQAGTVGTPLPGCQIAVDDDGEILIGGIGVFQEYWGLKAETKATRVMIDGKPWVRSGDIGTLTDGVLRIVDRKKELEILDTGKKIAPVRVEELLKSASSYVEDSLLVGTDRPYAGMLIQPAYDSLIRWAEDEGITADDVVMQKAPTGEQQAYGVGPKLLGHPKVQELFQAAIDTVNAGVADFERVRKWVLVQHAFTLDRGELTPSFKKKRKAIIANYKSQIENLFASKAG